MADAGGGRALGVAHDVDRVRHIAVHLGHAVAVACVLPPPAQCQYDVCSIPVPDCCRHPQTCRTLQMPAATVLLVRMLRKWRALCGALCGGLPTCTVACRQHVYEELVGRRAVCEKGLQLLCSPRAAVHAPMRR